MIKLQVIGNLGRDCVENDVNGNHVINFVVAHSSKIRDVEKTVWVDCAYWTDKVGIVPFLKKGTSVYVEGTPDVRTYQTSDGRQGASLTLRVASIQLLGSSNNNNAPTSNPISSNPTTSSSPAPTVAPDEVEDDLPF